MKLFKSDQLFEEAGRSPESCEKLIARLKRQRRVRWIVLLGTVVITIGFCVWGFVLALRVLYWMETKSPSLPEPNLPFDATLIKMLTPMVLVFMITQIINISHNDACLKMLLILRAQQGLSSRRDARN